MTTAVQDRNKWNSAVFKAYNKAEKARRDGKFRIDLPTLRKAFGLAISQEVRPYNSSIFDCDCPWRLKTHKICKHMAAEMIKYRAAHPKDATCPHLHTTLLMANEAEFRWVRVCFDCKQVVEE